MRVLLSNSIREENFSEALQSAAEAAGLRLDADLRPRSPRVARVASHLQQLANREMESRASMLTASIESYLQHLGEGQIRRPARPADLKTIANELCITAQMTLSDLNRLRRDFALANHPDRTVEDDRDNATRRMMIANMLIDREIKRRRPQPTP